MSQIVNPEILTPGMKPSLKLIRETVMVGRSHTGQSTMSIPSQAALQSEEAGSVTAERLILAFILLGSIAGGLLGYLALNLCPVTFPMATMVMASVSSMTVGAAVGLLTASLLDVMVTGSLDD